MLVALAAPAATATAATTTTTAAARRTTTTTSSPEAVRKTAIASQLQSLRAQVAEASAKEADVLDAIDDVAGKRKLIESELAALDAQLAKTQAELEISSGQLGQVSSDLQRAGTKLAATETGLAGARGELTDRAVHAYMRQPVAQAATVLLERQTYRELAAAHGFLKSFFEAQERSVDRYLDLRAAISDERESLARARDEVSAQTEVVTLHRDELTAVRSRQASLRAQATIEEGRQKTLLSDVRGRVREFEAEIATLKKESDAISALLRRRQRSQVKAPSGAGVLTAPVPGVITSGFGPRPHPIFGTVRMHNGVDYSGSAGTPVRAAADATVAVASDRGGYGNTVILDHGNALATLYAHLSRAAVTEGASVRRGAVIGYVGSSGLSTGPHLHFEVRAAGNPVDPRRYL